MEQLKIEEVFADLPEVRTERLLLRKLREGDAAEMFSYSSNPEVAKYVPWEAHKTIEDSKTFIAFVMKKYADRAVAEWGVELKDEGRLIGTCGFVWWKPEHAKAELGYAISREYWGLGLTSEAAGAAIRFGFDRMKLHRIEARCVPENTGSERVMMKNGMKFEGLHRDSVYEKGGFRSLKVYSILAADFRKESF